MRILVCLSLLFCLTLASQPIKLVKPVVAVPQAQNGIGCTICTLLVGYAEDYLGSNSTLAEIETFLNTTVCNLLPSFLRPECASLVDEYAPQIAQKIFQGYPANVVCKDVGLCSSVKVTASVKPMSGLLCSVCQVAAGFGLDYIESNTTLAEVETFLNTTVCDFFPSFLRPECASLVDQYAPQIASRVFSKFTPQAVCSDIGLCAKSAVLVKPALMLKLVPVKAAAVKPALMLKLLPAKPVAHAQNGIGCTICTLLVGYAEDYLGSNSTLAEIETFLNTTVCNLLPSFLRPECASLVDQYAPVMAQKIAQGYPANVVCKDVGLCSSVKAASKPSLLRKLIPSAEINKKIASLRKRRFHK